MVTAAPPRRTRTRPLALPDEEEFTRHLARQDLGEYAQYVHGQTPARHHRQWLDRIHRLLTQDQGPRRVLFIAPPQHAKSFYLSLVFPCWYLGTHPDRSILFVTSSDRMARQFGSTVKLTLESNSRYAAVFPDPRCRPCPDRGWSTEALYVQGAPATEKDPSYQAVGFGASVLGARADVLILDDPLSQVAAESEAEREQAARYYDMTLVQRLRPHGVALAITTRWHASDLAAHLIKQGWEVMAYPALGTYAWGQALWPEQFSEAWLLAEQARLGGPLFSCVFNGDPTSLGGDIFRREWFTRAGLPETFEAQIRPHLTKVQFIDLAFSERASADYTASVTVGLRPGDERLYVLGVWRDRIDEQRLDEAILAQIMLHRPALVGIEEGAFKQAVTRDLVRRVTAAAHRAGIPVAVLAVKVGGDKVMRARLPAARLQAGTLRCDQGAPWYPDFVTECTAFPRGAHDDQVDSLAGATQLAVESAALALEDARPSTYSFSPAAAGAGGPLAPTGVPDPDREVDALQRDLFEPKVQRPAAARPRWPFLNAEQQAQLDRALAAQRARVGDDDEGEEA